MASINTPITTTTKLNALALIDSLITNPNATDEEPYFRAINYFLFNGKDHERALALIARMQGINKGEYPYRMLIRANIQAGRKKAALKAVDDGISIVKRDFADEPERLASIVASYNKQRLLIEADDVDGRRAW